jgi:hypothetical protein
LQRQEVLVRLELRIGLLQPLQRDDRRRQPPLSLAERAHRLGIAKLLGAELDASGVRPGFGDFAKHVTLLRGRALYARDQIGNEVCAALILVLDVGPARLGFFLGGRDRVDAATGERHCRDGSHERDPEASRGHSRSSLSFSLRAT